MRRLALSFAPLVAGVCLGAALAPGALAAGLRFLAFVLLLVVPLGHAVGRLAFPTLAAGDRLRLAPIVGVAAVVLVSSITARLHVLGASAVLALPAAWGLFLLVREARKGELHGDGTDLVQAGAATVAVLVVTVTYVLPSLPPTPTREGLVYQDTLWTIGNTESLLHWGLPLRDLRFDGATFGYHFAQNVFEATACRLAFLDPFETHVLFEPAFVLFCLAAAASHATRIFLGLSTTTAAFVAAALLFVTDPRGAFHGNTYFCPLSYAFGVPAFVLFAAMIVGDLRGGPVVAPLGAGLVFFLAASAKAHLLVLLPLALLPAAAARWRRLRQMPERREWLLVAGIVLSAVLLRATLFAGDSKGYGLETWPVNPQAFFYRLVHDKLHLGPLAPVVFGVYHVARPFFGNVLSALAFPPMIVLLGIVALSREARAALRGDLGVRFVLVFALASLGAISVLRVVGGVAYFTLYPQVALVLVAALAFDAARASALVRGLAAVGIAAGTAFFARAIHARQAHWGALPTDGRGAWDREATITRGEWSACRWVHDHAEPDAVFFSDRRGFVHELDKVKLPRFFGYTALTGHQAFVEGDEFLGPTTKPLAEARWREIDEVLTADGDAVDRELRDVKAAYFIQSLRFDRRDFTRARSLELVHETADARVYKLRGAPTP